MDSSLQEDNELNGNEYSCYVCGGSISHVSRHLSDELVTCKLNFMEKLSQIASIDEAAKQTDVVCESCWSLLENITKHEDELSLMIQDVNERLSRTCQQNLNNEECDNTSEHELEDTEQNSEPSKSPTPEAVVPGSSDGAETTLDAEDGPQVQAVSCPDCPSRSFSSTASLHRHRRKKHERHLGCPFCSLPVRESYLEMHILIKHSKTDKGYLCTLCDRYYNSAKYLKVHLRTVHSDGKQFQCTECGRLLANRGSLHAHMQRHARSHQCPVCGRRFALRTQLETHQRHHTGERPFLCTDCGKAFISAERMRKHAHVHSVEPTCSTCGRVFASHAGLLAHQRTHSGERPFTCTVCGKTFKRAAHLSDHLSGVHGGSRPFKCGQCDRAFTLEPYLRRHERLHAGEKPHGCTLCGKRFAKKFNLQAHQKTHDGGPAPVASEAAPPPAAYPGPPVPLVPPAAPLASGLTIPAVGPLTVPPTGFPPPPAQPPPPLQLHPGYIWS